MYSEQRHCHEHRSHHTHTQGAWNGADLVLAVEVVVQVVVAELLRPVRGEPLNVRCAE